MVSGFSGSKAEDIEHEMCLAWAVVKVDRCMKSSSFFTITLTLTHSHGQTAGQPGYQAKDEPTAKHVPVRKTFAKIRSFRVNPLKSYALMEKKLKKTIEVQQYVSRTADIWSANHSCFMRVMVHCIDAGQKVAIACLRFRD